MKKRLFLLFMLFMIPMFILSFDKVSVEANDDTHSISVNYASEVDEQGGPVLGEAVAEVAINEESTFYGNTNTLQVVSTNEGYHFSFYMEKGYVVSSSPNYIFRVVEDHDFLAFFRPADKKQVVIMDANNKHLGSILVDDEFILEEVALDPFKAKLNNPPGYEMVGWNVEFPLTVTNDITFVRAVYAAEETTFTVNVYHGEEVVDTHEVLYGKTFTVTAPVVEGLTFSHWEVDGQPIGYNVEHTLSVYADIDIHAVFAEEAVQPVGLSYLNKNVITNDTIHYLLSQSYIPTGYKLVEQGIIFVDSDQVLTSPITLETANVQRVRALRFSSNNEFAVSLNTINHHNLYARGYLVLEDLEGGFEYIYSDQLMKQFKFEITYNLDGGTNHQNNKEIFSTYEEVVLNAPTKAGYNFVGWFTAASGGTQVTNIPKGTTTNQVLFARWELATFNLTLNLDGGSFTFASKAALKEEFFRDLYNFINPEDTYQDFVHGHGKTSGYAGEWYINTTYRNKIASRNNKTMDDSLGLFVNDSRYNAKWVPFFDMLDGLITQANPVQSFWDDINTGLMRLSAYMTEIMFADKTQTPEFAPQSTFTMNSDDIYLPNPSKAGYKFIGWFTAASGGTQVTKIAKGTTNNVILFARWEPLTQYTILYNLNGGTLSNPINEYNANELPIILGIPVREQYTFLGWYLTADFSDNPITELGFNTTGNITLYAQWEAASQHEIVYNLNGGIWGYQSKTVMRERFFQDLYTFLNVTIPYDQFVGSEYYGLWANDTKYRDNVFQLNNRNIIPGSKIFINDPTYNMRWLPFFDMIDEFTTLTNPTQSLWGSPSTGRIRIGNYFAGAVFNAERLNTLPDFSPKVLSFNKYDDRIYLNIPNRTGYKFDGWYSNESFTGEPLTYIETGTDQTMTLYAKWTALPSYTITYNLNGGTLANPVNSYTWHTLPITLGTPTKGSETFGGWYDNPDFTGTPITTIIYPETGNKTYYAKWITNEEYTITLHQGRDYTKDTKNDMITDLLTDFYNYLGKPGGNLNTFMHGAGKTGGYDGTWTTQTGKLMNIPRPDAPNNSLNFFFAHETYYDKWMPFADFMHQMSIDRNDALFWSSAYTGRLRIKQYFQNTSIQQTYLDKVPTFAPITIKYFVDSPTVTLPTLSINGKTFVGWFTAQSGGEQVTTVPTGSTGNKTYYARWS